LLGDLLTLSNNENLNFSYTKQCEGSAPVFDSAVHQPKWQNYSVEVNATILPNCGTFMVFGDDSVNNEIVYLKYKAVTDVIYLCHCPFNIKYRIKGLKRKDYVFILVDEDSIIYEPVWYHQFWKAREHPH